MAKDEWICFQYKRDIWFLFCDINVRARGIVFSFALFYKARALWRWIRPVIDVFRAWTNTTIYTRINTNFY